jgi:hypothetical protein
VASMKLNQSAYALDKATSISVRTRKGCINPCAHAIAVVRRNVEILYFEQSKAMVPKEAPRRETSEPLVSSTVMLVSNLLAGSTTSVQFQQNWAVDNQPLTTP